MNPIKDDQRDPNQQAIARWENEGGALKSSPVNTPSRARMSADRSTVRPSPKVSIRDEHATSLRART
jgi:hypothetical protein